MVTSVQGKVRELQELIAVSTMIQKERVVLETYCRCHLWFNGLEGQNKYREHFNLLMNIPRRPSRGHFRVTFCLLSDLGKTRIYRVKSKARKLSQTNVY